MSSQAAEHSLWVFDSVLQFLSSPLWTSQILTFIDENCLAFDTEEESKFAYTDLHEKFKSLVEALIESHLSESGITPEQFVEACEVGASNPASQAVLRHILAVDDFATFKALMVKRNLELNEEALRMWTLKEKARESAGISGGDADGFAENDDDDGVAGYGAAGEELDEEEMLRRAINMSLEEHQKLLNQGKSLEQMAEEQLRLAMTTSEADAQAMQAARAREDAELEMAIAMSLALEEEKRKQDEILKNAESGERKRKEKEEQLRQQRLKEEAAMRALAEKNQRDDATIAKLEEERLRKEAELSRRAESARKIMEELREAKDVAVNESLKSRERKAPPPTLMPESQASGADKDVEEEIRNRQAFLKKTRDSLVARKAKERQEEAKRYQEAHGRSLPEDSSLPHGASSSSSSSSSDSAQDDKIRMRLALQHRIKAEMIEEEERRRSAASGSSGNNKGGSSSRGAHGGVMAEDAARIEAQRRIVEQELDGRKRMQEEAKLAEMQREAERRRALDALHENLKVVDATDDFAFNE